MTARPGAALAIAIVVLLALNCVVLGTLHIALLERRVSTNAATALRLRLAAESAVAAQAARVDAAFDTVPIGGRVLLASAATPTGDLTEVTLHRVTETLLLMRAEARLPNPLSGAAAHTLLLRPPAIPSFIDAAAHGLSSRTLSLVGSGAVHSTGVPDCAGAAPVTHPPDSLLLASHAPRVRTLAASRETADVRTVDGSLSLDAAFTGVVVATGDIHLVAMATVHGIVIAGGALRIDPGAMIVGAAHAASATVAGVIEHDACTAQQAVRTARLDLPSPAGARAWRPSF